jgi:phage portal protein BeeE
MYPEPSTADLLTQQAAAASKKALARVRKEDRDIGINTPGMADIFAFGDRGGTITGVHITQEKSLQLSAVYACVTFIADYVASLPKFPYERLQKGKRRAQNHWLYPLIHDQPNPYMNYEFVGV